MIKKFQNNKGLTSFLAVIIVLLLLACFAFLFDLVNIARKRHAFNRHINYVSRVVARQGGIRPNKPDWLERLDYQTGEDLLNLTTSVLEKNNIYGEDWEIYIGKYKDMDKNPPLSESMNSNFDFGDDIYIFGVVRYDYPLTSGLMATINPDKREYLYVRKVASEAWNRHKENNNWLDNTQNMW